jgi:branched-subunit amino acid transport protein
MTHARLLALIFAVAAASYALRAIPLALLRRPLRDRRLVAFIERLPYALLAAMVVPDVFSSTGDPLSATIGFAVALVLALLGRSLPLVAAAATAAAIAVVIALHSSL